MKMSRKSKLRQGRPICSFKFSPKRLMATRIISKVAETFGVEPTMRNFLDAPAVAGLAGIVATLSGSKKNAEQVISESTCGDETGEI